MHFHVGQVKSFIHREELNSKYTNTKNQMNVLLMKMSIESIIKEKNQQTNLKRN